MIDVTRHVLTASLLLAGCASPPAPAPVLVAPPETPEESLTRAAATLARALPTDAGGGVRLAVIPEGALPAAVDAYVEQALLPRLLEATPPPARERLATGQAGEARVTTTPLGARWQATHALRPSARARPDGGWTLTCELVNLATGEVLARAEQGLDERPVPPPATEADLPRFEALRSRTLELLAAAKRGDGAPIVAVLDPELERTWRRRAAHAGWTLEAWAVDHLGQLKHRGPVGEVEVEVVGLHAEVEVELRDKVRDVDFHWHRVGDRWRLTAVRDID